MVLLLGLLSTSVLAATVEKIDYSQVEIKKIFGLPEVPNVMPGDNVHIGKGVWTDMRPLSYIDVDIADDLYIRSQYLPSSTCGTTTDITSSTKTYNKLVIEPHYLPSVKIPLKQHASLVGIGIVCGLD